MTDDERKCIVYCHVNKINDKKYFGITSQTKEERWRKGKGYKNCPYFANAIQEYGWDNFEHLIICKGLTREEACEHEKRWIALFQTNNADFGYNLTEGGDVHALTEETKMKISESHLGEKNPMYGRKHTEEELDFLRNRFSGEGNPNYGKKNTPETRRKISEALTGRHLSEEHKDKLRIITSKRFKGRPRPKNSGRKRKRIICVETGNIYESIAEAARQTGANKSWISKVAKGQAISSGGFHWSYID